MAGEHATASAGYLHIRMALRADNLQISSLALSLNDLTGLMGRKVLGLASVGSAGLQAKHRV